MQTTYKVVVVNKILNFRRFIFVSASSYLDAIHQAKSKISGYKDVESCVPVVIQTISVDI